MPISDVTALHHGNQGDDQRPQQIRHVPRQASRSPPMHPRRGEQQRAEQEQDHDLVQAESSVSGGVTNCSTRRAVRGGHFPAIPSCEPHGDRAVRCPLCWRAAARRNTTVDTMRYWLMKSEPDECSIDMLAAMPGQRVPWFGVRNYQARNFMRDAMRIGDLAFFYHSSCAEPGIAGIVRVASGPYPDATQFDPASPYYDAKARPEAPRWVLVDVRSEEHTSELQSRPHLVCRLLLEKKKKKK